MVWPTIVISPMLSHVCKISLFMFMWLACFVYKIMLWMKVALPVFFADWSLRTIWKYGSSYDPRIGDTLVYALSVRDWEFKWTDLLYDDNWTAYWLLMKSQIWIWSVGMIWYYVSSLYCDLCMIFLGLLSHAKLNEPRLLRRQHTVAPHISLENVEGKWPPMRARRTIAIKPSPSDKLIGGQTAHH